jgi:hypothetical protein
MITSGFGSRLGRTAAAALLSAATAVGLSVAPAQATATPQPAIRPATSPGGRDSESLTYDSATQTAIMYGGFNSGGRLSDT